MSTRSGADKLAADEKKAVRGESHARALRVRYFSAVAVASLSSPSLRHVVASFLQSPPRSIRHLREVEKDREFSSCCSENDEPLKWRGRSRKRGENHDDDVARMEPCDLVSSSLTEIPLVGGSRRGTDAMSLLEAQSRFDEFRALVTAGRHAAALALLCPAASLSVAPQLELEMMPLRDVPDEHVVVFSRGGVVPLVELALSASDMTQCPLTSSWRSDSEQQWQQQTKRCTVMQLALEYGATEIVNVLMSTILSSHFALSLVRSSRFSLERQCFSPPEQSNNVSSRSDADNDYRAVDGDKLGLDRLLLSLQRKTVAIWASVFLCADRSTSVVHVALQRGQVVTAQRMLSRLWDFFLQNGDPQHGVYGTTQPLLAHTKQREETQAKAQQSFDSVTVMMMIQSNILQLQRDLCNEILLFRSGGGGGASSRAAGLSLWHIAFRSPRAGACLLRQLLHCMEHARERAELHWEAHRLEQLVDDHNMTTAALPPISCSDDIPVVGSLALLVREILSCSSQHACVANWARSCLPAVETALTQCEAVATRCKLLQHRTLEQLCEAPEMCGVSPLHNLASSTAATSALRRAAAGKIADMPDHRERDSSTSDGDDVGAVLDLVAAVASFRNCCFSATSKSSIRRHEEMLAPVETLRRFLGPASLTSVIYTAACHGNAAFLEKICTPCPVHSMLLSAAVNGRNLAELGATPLWAAASRGHADLIVTLAAAGADPHAINDRGVTALSAAVQCGHKKASQVLVELGAEVTPDIVALAARVHHHHHHRSLSGDDRDQHEEDGDSDLYHPSSLSSRAANESAASSQQEGAGRGVSPTIAVLLEAQLHHDVGGPSGSEGVYSWYVIAVLWVLVSFAAAKLLS
jgi:hypothetical protein